MKVLKFGGTSVGTAERMRMLPALLPTDGPHIVVLSAMSGTTNVLATIVQQLYAGHRPAAAAQLDRLRVHYHGVARELLPDAAVLANALLAVDTCFDAIDALLPLLPTLTSERIILAQGELLSTLLFHRYLTGILGQTVVLLPALEFMRLRPDHEPDASFIENQLTDMLSNYPECQCFITQGYICRDAKKCVDNLKRGGSDYSATLIGAAVRASEIQIWTDIDGLHNNDPRVVKGTYPIRELSFDEAAELAYFGAKILHPCSVLPAWEHGIPLRLLNTMQPEAPGTLISSRGHAGGIKAVSVKDGLLVLKVCSNRRIVAYDFLHAVFDIFKRHHTTIDLVATAETAVSLAVEEVDAMPLIVADLQKLGHVTVVRDVSVVCVVGQQLVRSSYDGPQLVFNALRNIDLHMISYGGSVNSLCLLINASNKVSVLQILNDRVFNAGIGPLLHVSDDQEVTELVA
ncbi:aspartate kinase [Hymenobacter actinosclerus]|nr:aspartate kinase [Hymenobacter actinosclerus]